MAWWVWVIIVLGSMIALFGVLSIAGTFLPVGHEASRTREIAAPPDDVWRAVDDFASWPSWMPQVKKMERRDRDGAEIWVMTTSQGEMPSRVVERLAPSRLVTQIADPRLPFGGTWTWEIAPAPSGDGTSRVTITERGEIYNPLFRFIARYVMGYHATIEAFLRALDRRFASRERN